MEISLPEYFDELVGPNQPAAPQSPQGQQRTKKRNYRPDTDIVLWLTHNAPSSFDELIDIRYSLYHRCSRAGYLVKRLNEEEFKLMGRHSTLHIVSNMARRFLLSKLRELAKEKGWMGALPKTMPRRAGQ
jgi:hypothetical protein